jgi:cobalt-precorrin 5A hydrolase
MANSGVKINEMGNEVVDGFECKPKNYDANRPIMHYKTLILLCDDERCQKASSKEKPKELRELLKELGLNKGKNRIKITRTMCNGACRFRQVAHISENMQQNGNAKNTSLWLKHTHQYSLEKWSEIFKALSEDMALERLLDKDEFIQMKVY